VETHIEGTMDGDSFREYNLWSLMKRFKCMETLIRVTKFGDLNRGCNVRRHI